MKLLLDLCMSPAVATAARAAGHDVVRVGTAPEERGDEAVIRLALEEGRIIVTVEKNFGELLTLARGPRVGVLRVLDLPPARQSAFVLAALEVHGQELASGALVVADPVRTRIRMPPAG